MQEAKHFSTALFGFERKAVLDYIYEQDKQARAALEELAVRNDALDRKAAELTERLEALNSQYQQAIKEREDAEQKLSGQGSDCTRLRERAGKLAGQLREKENALQLQMELNKRMQTRINEQETVITKLREELKEAQERADLFSGRQENFNDLKNQLDEIRIQFAERLSKFEEDFKRLEAEVPCCRAKERESGKPKAGPQAPVVHKVALKRLESGAVQQEKKPAGNAGNRVCKILKEWK